MQVFAMAPQTIASIPETEFEARPTVAATPITWKTAASPNPLAGLLGRIGVAVGAFAVPRMGRVLQAISMFLAVRRPVYTLAPPARPEPVGPSGRAIAARSPEPAETRARAEVE